MALTLEQRRSLSMAQAKLKQSRVRVIGQRMINRAAPAGTLPPDVRVRRTFEDIGEPDTSANEGIASGYQNSAVNSQLAQEQGVSPMSGGESLGEAIQSDAGYGFYDPAGKFALANERDHVLLKDPATGRLSIFPRDPSMEEGGGMGLARMFLGGAAGGAPTRVAGGVGGAVARAAPQAAARAPSAMGQTVQAYDRAGVDPSLLTALQNRATGVAANALRNTPAGGPIQRGIAGNIQQAGAGVDQLAGTLSNVGDVATAGSRVRGGAQEFVEAIVPAKQRELYGEAERLIGEAGRTAMPRTWQVLDEMEGAISDPAIRDFITDPNVSGLANTIRDAATRGITFRDIRQFRTEIRGLKPSQESKVGLNKTAINKIYTAMTKDMEGMALAAGGDEALTALRRADLFTARQMGGPGNLQATTAPVRVLKELVDGKSDEQIYSRLYQWSGNGAGADVSKLNLVKQAILRTDDSKTAWNDFTGTFLRRMGKVKPGAVATADAEEWSPSNFMTSYETMSPQARTIMFSESPTLRSALDDYLTVAGDLKRLQRLGNPSGSGAHVITMATLAWVFTEPMTALSAIASGNVAARIMTNPSLVRWLSRAGRIGIQSRNQPPARTDMSWRAHIRSLAAIAGNDNEITAPLLKTIEEMRGTARGEQGENTTQREAPL